MTSFISFPGLFRVWKLGSRSRAVSLELGIEHLARLKLNCPTVLVTAWKPAQSSLFDGKRLNPAPFRHGNIREIKVDLANKDHVAMGCRSDRRE